jgi:hypothetical protein
VELQKDADNKLEPEPQWCPTNIFSRRQKRRAYRMRCQELMDKKQRCYDEGDEQPPVQKVWRPKMQSQIHWQKAAVNMVLVLPESLKL